MFMLNKSDKIHSIYCRIPFIYNPRKWKPIHSDRKQIVIACRWEMETGEEKGGRDLKRDDG
jgi:hypothetical protein